MDAVRSATVTQMADVDGLGEKKAPAIVAQLTALSPVIDRLAAHGLAMDQAPAEAPAPADQPLAGMTVVVTGKMTGPLAGTRGEVEDKLTALGATVSSSVNGKASVLFCGTGGGSKRDKATAAGVRIVEEADFDAFVADAGGRAELGL